MRSDLACYDVAPDLSAYLDEELDRVRAAAIEQHLAHCPRCSNELAQLRRVRAALRLQPADPVPDLSADIMQRVAREAVRHRSVDRRAGLRSAALGAAAAVLLLLGTTIRWDDRPSDAAAAGEISAAVRSAARELTSYRASFTIEERGWHARVPLRRLRAQLWFAAPEEFSLQIRDLTSYPDQRWPRNNVDLRSNGRRIWIREPSSCPPAALPGCAAESSQLERTVTRRKPFDASIVLPTDVVLPLESLAASASFRVVQSGVVNERSAYRVSLPYRDALPLVQALQPGGSWRPFHPLDEVRVWLDRRTWFPLDIEVVAGASPDRSQWGLAAGVGDERRGTVLFRARATSFEDNVVIADDVFDVPVRGSITDGAFRAAPTRSALPAVAGLAPYRFGRVGATSVRSYARGMTWLRIERRPARRLPVVPPTAQELRVGDGFGYYQAADQTSKRRVDVYADNTHVHIESNLRRDELLAVAARVAPPGNRAPLSVTRGGMSVERVPPRRLERLAFVSPGWLPAGYGPKPSSAVVTRSPESRTLTAYYTRRHAEYEGFGVRITQSTSRLLPPSSEQFMSVRIGGSIGRWSVERGELEWLEGSRYTAVAVPSFDLATAVRIASTIR